MALIARNVDQSRTEMTELVLPQHSNAMGTAFGGTLLAWMDICGAITAYRHSGNVAVTAAMDEVDFVAPIRLGDVVILSGQINAAFRTSVEIQVCADVEDRATGKRTRSAEAFMTFVAVTDDGQPVPVPPLKCTTPEELEREQQAQARRKKRLAKRK